MSCFCWEQFKHCTGWFSSSQACSSLDVDLISLDLSQRLPFRLRPALLKPAIGRGIMFEVSQCSFDWVAPTVLHQAAGAASLFCKVLCWLLMHMLCQSPQVCYSRAVTEEDARRQFLSNAQALSRCLKGKVRTWTSRTRSMMKQVHAGLWYTAAVQPAQDATTNKLSS
jgi:hypothetical protein